MPVRLPGLLGMAVEQAAAAGRYLSNCKSLLEPAQFQGVKAQQREALLAAVSKTALTLEQKDSFLLALRTQNCWEPEDLSKLAASLNEGPEKPDAEEGTRPGRKMQDYTVTVFPYYLSECYWQRLQNPQVPLFAKLVEAAEFLVQKLYVRNPSEPTASVLSHLLLEVCPVPGNPPQWELLLLVKEQLRRAVEDCKVAAPQFVQKLPRPENWTLPRYFHEPCLTPPLHLESLLSKALATPMRTSHRQMRQQNSDSKVDSRVLAQLLAGDTTVVSQLARQNSTSSRTAAAAARQLALKQTAVALRPAAVKCRAQFADMSKVVTTIVPARNWQACLG